MLSLSERNGFTLIEMLISIVLSSVIFISSYQVISNLIQYQVRAGERYEGQVDKLLIKNLISQIIEKSLHQYELFYRSQKGVFFRGEGDSVQLISRAYSQQFDEPGYRVYRLYQREGELYVSYRKFDVEYKSNRLFEITTGLKIEDLNFQYLADNEWLNEWQEEESFPDYIRITIDLPDAESIEWIRATGHR